MAASYLLSARKNIHRKDRERNKFHLFPLVRKKMDEYPWVRSVLDTVAAVFGKGETKE
jgi:hypothetical protein